jgi:iron(III) transport system permease protein
MTVWSVHVVNDSDVRLGGYAVHSLVLGILVAITAGLAALVLTIAQRYFKGPTVTAAGRIAVLGYALPGSVLAVGVFLPLVWVDKKLATAIETLTGHDVGLVLTGTVFAMVLGLSARFVAVAYTSLSNGCSRISRRLDEAATMSGVVGSAAVRRVHLPLLKRAILTGSVLVFVDVLKEMPLTLMTRPFGWDTLSVRIYELTNEGEWQKAALPAMVLLITGLIPVAWLSRSQDDERRERRAQRA